MDDYALSKDVDVALWMDSMQFNGELPLVDAQDFVIVNSQLHDDFDRFKKEIKPLHSFLAFIELLEYYCLSEMQEYSTVMKYGKEYLEVNAKQIDALVQWVYETRKKYKEECGGIFQTPIIEKLIKRSIGKIIADV